MTHTYIKPSSNQRSTTLRVASAAGRLGSSRLVGNDHRACPQFWEDYGAIRKQSPCLNNAPSEVKESAFRTSFTEKV